MRSKEEIKESINISKQMQADGFITAEASKKTIKLLEWVLNEQKDGE